jgi:hypothetical protein
MLCESALTRPMRYAFGEPNYLQTKSKPMKIKPSIRPTETEIAVVPPHVTLRYMQGSDAPYVCYLDRIEYGEGNSLELLKLINFIDSPVMTPIVAVFRNRVVAYSIYELIDAGVKILRLVVCPRYRLKQFGTVMMDHIKTRLVPDEHYAIFEADEYDVPAQLFLQRQKFICSRAVGRTLVMEYAA